MSPTKRGPLLEYGVPDVEFLDMVCQWSDRFLAGGTIDRAEMVNGKTLFRADPMVRKKNRAETRFNEKKKINLLFALWVSLPEGI